MLALAINVYADRDGERGRRAPSGLFAFSILYLFVLFADICWSSSSPRSLRAGSPDDGRMTMADGRQPKPDGIVLTDGAAKAAAAHARSPSRWRSACWCVLFYVVTMVKGRPC